ncbi:hypothetical protein KM043_017099 [Ampulex compressa]|nr:hypothetical protein KM043_017099 [Ampulex compressa]
MQMILDFGTSSFTAAASSLGHWEGAQQEVYLRRHNLTDCRCLAHIISEPCRTKFARHYWRRRFSSGMSGLFKVTEESGQTCTMVTYKPRVYSSRPVNLLNRAVTYSRGKDTCLMSVTLVLVESRWMETIRVEGAEVEHRCVCSFRCVNEPMELHLAVFGSGS